jgi:hypothetical protein
MAETSLRLEIGKSECRSKNIHEYTIAICTVLWGRFSAHNREMMIDDGL